MRPTAAILLLLTALAWTAVADVSPPVAPGVADSKPFPPVEHLLTRIILRAGLDRDLDKQFDAHYRYTRSKETVTKDGDGDIQKSVVIEFENDPATGTTAEDPNEYTPDTKRKYNRRDFKVDRPLLDRYDFRITARELVAGRPTLLMEFQPADKKLPSKDLKDRFLNRTRGRVWVDEEEAAIVRAETQLVEEVRFLGGLVANVSKCEFRFTRARSPEGWWWVQSAEWHVEARKFFSRLVVDYEEQAAGVEKVR